MARQVGVTLSLNQTKSFQHEMKGENNIVIVRDTKRELSSLLWAIHFVDEDKVTFVDNTVAVVDNTPTTLGDTLKVVDNSHCCGK